MRGGSHPDRQPSPELDTVVDHLRRQFHLPELRLDAPPARLSGGFWAEMWSLTLNASTGAGLPD